MDMKKGIILLKAFAFLLIFAVLFCSVQEVLRYKYEEEMKLRTVYRTYMEEAEGSVDVVFIGGSSPFADVVPPLMWKESGITAYNFGISSASSLINYYQLRFLLEERTQKPKLVVFDFHAIDRDLMPDEAKGNEKQPKTLVVSMPFWDLRNEMILQIKKENPNQDILTYYFPLLEFHSRWNIITKNDFSPKEYEEYKKGALFSVKKSKETINSNPELYEADIEPGPISEYSWGYYKQIIDLCAENEIEIAVVGFPRNITNNWISKSKTIEQVCDENNIRFYDLSTPGNWDALAIDGATDFYDSGHLNASGATKLSKALAEIFQEDFGLPDHRGDPAYSAWDDTWDAFYAAYENVLAPFGY